jgi:pimeloyl-ACP methyl ester carboxylesterase
MTGYLGAYGNRFRDGVLQQHASEVDASPLHRTALDPRHLAHLLVNTPAADTVEVFAVGEGVPVLLMPAVGLTAPTWKNQLGSVFAREMQLIVVHPPGYGLTKPIEDSTIAGVAGVFKAVIDALVPGRPVHLVGSCLSCVSALYLASHHPERVASMTLVGGFHSTDDMLSTDPNRLTSDEFSQLLLTALDRIRNDFAGIIPGRNQPAASVTAARDFLLNSLCANPLVAMRYLSEMLTMSPLPWLSTVRVATQCLYGTRDTIVNPAQSKTIAEGIPGARLVAIDGAGHFPYLTHHEQFDVILEAFVSAQKTVATASEPLAV